MLRPYAAALAALVASASLGGCTGEQPAPPSGTRSVEAFPQPPHVTGPVDVELRPALAIVNGAGGCKPEPEAGRLCAPDGTGGYRVLGTVRPVVVSDVTAAPSTDRTSWGTIVRFAPGSRPDVRRARAQAAGFGGVVLVTEGDRALAVVPPPDLSATRARFLGLERAEAWMLVDAFSGSK